MLLIVAGLGWANRAAPEDVASAFIILGLVCGLCVAPWLTMLSGGPLGGTVFTIQIPGALWVLSQLLLPRGDLRLQVFWTSMLAFCVLAAALGWRAFMRLEAIDGRASHFRLPLIRSRVAAGARDRHPIWLLIKKELLLQQLSLVLVAFYCAVWLVLVVTGQLGPRGRAPTFADFFQGVTILYSGMLSLLIGALASAEERQLGTLEWQTLLPMASSKQWAVKAGMAIGLALLFAVALPALLQFATGGGIGTNGLRILLYLLYLLAVLLMTVVSLFVSSICSSGLRAFLLSMPVTFALWILVVYFTELKWWSSPLFLGPLAASVVIVLWLAFENHRSAERRLWLFRW